MVCKSAVHCPSACDWLAGKIEAACATCGSQGAAMLKCARCGATAPGRVGDTCLACGMPGGMQPRQTMRMEGSNE
jgi:hypothetical protein